jgi:hypothetical protein
VSSVDIVREPSARRLRWGSTTGGRRRAPRRGTTSSSVLATSGTALFPLHFTLCSLMVVGADGLLHRIAGFYEKPGEIAAVHARAKDDKQRFWTCKERRVSEVRPRAFALAALVTHSLFDPQDHVRPFTFSKVPTTDQADQADDNLDFLNTISVIKLEYWFVKQAPAKKKDEKGKKKAAPKASTSTYTDPLANVDERAINENSDKGQFALNPGLVLPHCPRSLMLTRMLCSYGDLVVKPKELSTSGSSAQWKYVTISKKPDLTLIFRIRSRGSFLPPPSSFPCTDSPLSIVWIENFLNHGPSPSFFPSLHP